MTLGAYTNAEGTALAHAQNTTNREQRKDADLFGKSIAEQSAQNIGFLVVFSRISKASKTAVFCKQSQISDFMANKHQRPEK